MTFVTVSTIAVALLLMGAFLLATMNVEAFLGRLQSEAVVTAFLLPTAGREAVNSLKLQITGFDEVADAQAISPEEAAKELFVDPADQKMLDIGIGSGGNPLPYTLRIKVRSSRELDGLVAKLHGMNGIESVSYGEEAFKRFRGLSDLLWIGSLLIILLLGLSSLFIVYNTIALTLSLRREEIIIMRLVGATNWFIRWPFIIEGIIQGIVGAVIANGLLLVSYRFILARLSVLVPFFHFDIETGHLAKLAVKLVLMGVVLGISGSLLSLRNLHSYARRDAP